MGNEDKNSTEDDDTSKAKSQKDSDPTGILIVDHSPEPPPPPPQPALPTPKTPKPHQEPIVQNPVSTVDIDSQLAQLEESKDQNSKVPVSPISSFDFPRPAGTKPIAPYINEQEEDKIGENSIKRILGLLTPLSKVCIAVVILVLLGFLIFHSGVKYKKFTFKNTGYTYGLEFYADSVSSVDGPYQQVTGHQSDPFSALVFKSPYQEDCYKEFPVYKVLSKVKFQNVSFSVCAEPGQIIVFSSFDYNGVWQQAVIYSKNNKTPVNTGVATKTIQSVTVT